MYIASIIASACKLICSPTYTQVGAAVEEALAQGVASVRRLTQRVADLESEREGLVTQVSHLQDSVKAAR
jgi:hypothetical protein